MLGHDGPVREGGVIRVCEQVGVVPVVMFFRHTLCEPPHSFRDEMTHGPFDRFAHTHEFLPAPNGALYRETIELALPLLFGGERVLRLLIAPRIQTALEFRARAIRTLASNGALRKDA